VLALLGIWQGTRQVLAQWQLHPEWLQMTVRDGHVRDPSVNGPSWNLELQLYWIYVVLLAIVFVAWAARWLVERRRGLINIAYPGGRVVRVPIGCAVLDASRRASIPHAAICGGRGRCTTCRVRVLRGAIFGIHAGPREACSQALAAAQLIDSRLANMNRTLADELPEPLAIGVGLHAGNVILGELGYRDRFLLTAIGDSVHVAARLQELTKDYGCQLVVSDIVAATAEVEMSAFPVREISVRGRTESLAVRIVSAMNELVA
jgi:class 3 adenylate cyclase